MLVLTRPKAFAPGAYRAAESEASDALEFGEGLDGAGTGPFVLVALVGHTVPAYEWHVLAPPSDYE